VENVAVADEEYSYHKILLSLNAKICRVLQGFIGFSGRRNFVSVNYTIGISWQDLVFHSRV